MNKIIKGLLISAMLMPTMANVAAVAQNDVDSANSPANEKVAFLFTYFTGNRPEKEQICYALSDDGYNYTLLNQGLPVIKSDTIALTQCVRDPHILRCEDGKTFYMVATDMKSDLGWASNRGIVLMKSTDLIHWTHSTVNFPTRFPETWSHVTRVWAPETIYDHKAGKYMVFFSLLTDDGRCKYDKIYYSYANKDFTDLETEPKFLFDSGSATIDGDIVYNDADGLYHLFYKSEAHGGIFQATAKELTPGEWKKGGDQWKEIPGHVEVQPIAVEGVGVCRSLDGKSWVVMYDCYHDHHYQFCKSDDLKTFTWVADTKTSGEFTPRHGTIMPITRAERDRLIAKWGKTVNPVLPDFHADPEILYSKKTKRYYIYSTTDGTPGWGGHDFSCFSSTDLRNWKDEGKVLDVKGVEKDGKVTGDQVAWANGNAWAPAAIEKNGKYYLYFSAHNPDSNRKEIGCAISDSPTGPFVDCGHPIISDKDRPEGLKGGQAIDVDVFQDPRSGKCYLYWGNSFMAGAELNDDMISIKPETKVNLTPKGGTLADYNFREGTYVFYRKGTYYFMWSVDDTGADNYHVAYGTSTSPLGPIKVAERPIVLRQDPSRGIYGPAHNSVLQIPGKDEWYIVYHRINPNFRGAQHLSPGTHRQVCIDRMLFDKQGRIIEVQPTNDFPSSSLTLHPSSPTGVTVDTYYNHEVDDKGRVHHYTWDDTSIWGGYSEFGKMFQDLGGKLYQLDAAPTAENLKDSKVYVIVDPDHEKDNPHPNYMDAKAAKAVAQWVNDGGRLLVLTNDHDNCDLVHINTLMDIFGLHYNDVTILTKADKNKPGAEPRGFDNYAFVVDKSSSPAGIGQNETDHPIFNGAHRLYMLGTSTITCSNGATPLLKTKNGECVMAEAKYGKGTVIAVADPWIYNEYIGHTLLPDDFDNGTAANNLAKYLMK